MRYDAIGIGSRRDAAVTAKGEGAEAEDKDNGGAERAGRAAQEAEAAGHDTALGGVGD